MGTKFCSSNGPKINDLGLLEELTHIGRDHIPGIPRHGPVGPNLRPLLCMMKSLQVPIPWTRNVIKLCPYDIRYFDWVMLAVWHLIPPFFPFSSPPPFSFLLTPFCYLLLFNPCSIFKKLGSLSDYYSSCSCFWTQAGPSEVCLNCICAFIYLDRILCHARCIQLISSERWLWTKKLLNKKIYKNVLQYSQ